MTKTGNDLYDTRAHLSLSTSSFILGHWKHFCCCNKKHVLLYWPLCGITFSGSFVQLTNQRVLVNHFRALRYTLIFHALKSKGVSLVRILCPPVIYAMYSTNLDPNLEVQIPGCISFSKLGSYQRFVSQFGLSGYALLVNPDKNETAVQCFREFLMTSWTLTSQWTIPWRHNLLLLIPTNNGCQPLCLSTARMKTTA